MLGNRAIYHDGWIAATTPATIPWELSTKPAPDVITGYNWELYNVGKVDPTETGDLAAKMPDKLKEMQDLFYEEAGENDVLPLDNSSLTRWNTPRPSLTAGRKVFTYSGAPISVPNSGAPSILNKSYTITADVDDSGRRRGGHDRHRWRALRRIRAVPEQGRIWLRSGQGGVPVQPARPQAHGWEGPELSAGKHTIVFDFKSDGPGLGKGGTGVLSVDGKEVARNSIEHTTPITFPEDETFDIGQDTRTPLALIEYRYDSPFRFTGKINKVTFNLGEEKLTAEEQESGTQGPRSGTR